MLDKKYKFIQLDLILEEENNLNMVFSLSDNQTSDFYITIKKNNEKIDLSKYKTTLYIKNPKNTILHKELKDYDKTKNLFYCNLENFYKNMEGKYECQIIIEDMETTEKIVPLGKFFYDVEKDIISEENGSETPVSNIGIEYNADSKTIIFNCNATYNEETKIVEVI